MGVFADWQPRYGERGIPTFPVLLPEKTPAVRGYLRIGHAGSRRLVENFPHAEAIGFACGPVSRITVLDIDTSDEQVLADALAAHGPSPIVVRTGGNKFHVWYVHNGETRLIRPWSPKPIDLLGTGGFVVAPPSLGSQRAYEFLEGSLDELDRLRPIQGLVARADREEPSGVGRRNHDLWRHLMRQAHSCDDLDALLNVARDFNRALHAPLEDKEVIKAANSAWRYTTKGENRFGQTGAWFPTDEVNWLVPNFRWAFLLLSYLRANNGPRREFMITNSLADHLDVGRLRLAAARKKLIELGFIEQTRSARQHTPALYRWRQHRIEPRAPTLNEADDVVLQGAELPPPRSTPVPDREILSLRELIGEEQPSPDPAPSSVKTAPADEIANSRLLRAEVPPPQIDPNPAPANVKTTPLQSDQHQLAAPSGHVQRVRRWAAMSVDERREYLKRSGSIQQPPGPPRGRQMVDDPKKG